jgi:ribosome-associated heat shock protein Hsp15
MTSIEPEDDVTERIDRWLHAARWFKSRSLAVDAIANGRVTVNGVRAKPSRLVRVGDTIEIRRPPYTHEVRVCGLSARRLAAPLAQALYTETSSSVAARSTLAEELALSVVVERPHAGKLDKKDRRARERFKRSQTAPPGGADADR